MDSDTKWWDFGNGSFGTRFTLVALGAILCFAVFFVYSVQHNFVAGAGYPNDPYLGQQWHLDNTGQLIPEGEGTPGADIKALSAWNIQSDCSNTVVAVIDDGIDFSHPDLKNNAWTDTDGSHGYDFGDYDEDVSPDYGYDSEAGHGTEVSGVIGAEGNNSLGISGVCWHVKLMALKVYPETYDKDYKHDKTAALTNLSHAVGSAMDYIIQKKAAGANVKVVNISLGDFDKTSCDAFVHSEMSKLRDNGILVVLAAGNDNQTNLDTYPQYPACYTDLDNVIVAGSTDNDDNLSDFSNIGESTVQIAAPGEKILTTNIDQRYAFTWNELPGKNKGLLISYLNNQGYAILRGDAHIVNNGNTIDVIDIHSTSQYTLTLNGNSITLRSDDGLGHVVTVPNQLLVVRESGKTNVLDMSRTTTNVDSNSNSTYGYSYVDGTSFSSPMTAGVAALVASTHPAWDYKDIKKAVLDGADKLDSLAGKIGESRRLDAYGALSFGEVSGRVFIDNDKDGKFGPGDTPLGGTTVSLFAIGENAPISEARYMNEAFGKDYGTIENVTTSDGSFRFTHVPAGTILLSSEAIDKLKLNTAKFAYTLGANETIPNINFTYSQTLNNMTHGRVFYDENQNGKFEKGKEGVQGVIIHMAICNWAVGACDPTRALDGGTNGQYQEQYITTGADGYFEPGIPSFSDIQYLLNDDKTWYATGAPYCPSGINCPRAPYGHALMINVTLASPGYKVLGNKTTYYIYVMGDDGNLLESDLYKPVNHTTVYITHIKNPDDVKAKISSLDFPVISGPMANFTGQAYTYKNVNGTLDPTSIKFLPGINLNITDYLNDENITDKKTFQVHTDNNGKFSILVPDRDAETISVQNPTGIPADNIYYSLAKDMPAANYYAPGSSMQPFQCPDVDSVGNCLYNETISFNNSTGNIPIIFLPGIAGSELYNAGGSQLWPLPFPPSKVTGLALNNDGSSAQNITPGEILRGKLRSGWFFTNVYGSMIEYLVKKEGYAEGKDLFTFPYDWRLDNAQQFNLLDAKINEAMAKSGRDKVILLGHSMGGVLAKGYIMSGKYPNANRVDALITMGTPYWGAPKAFYAIVNGYSFGNPIVDVDNMKVLAQNAASAYQLLPRTSFVYVQNKSGQYNPILPDTIYNVTQYKHWDNSGNEVCCPKSLNPYLLGKANQYFAPFGDPSNPTPLPGGTKNFVIEGTGVQTLSLYKLRPFDPNVDKPNNYIMVNTGNQRIKVVFVPVFRDGDGTVPLWSSDIINPTKKWYVPDVSGYSAAHADLPKNAVVQDIVGEIVYAENNGQTPVGNPYWSSDTYQPSGNPRNIKEGCFGFCNLDFALHSDAHMSIADPSTGKSLGFNNYGGIDENLPGGTFLYIDGIEYASIQGLGTYKVTVNGTNSGEFTLTSHIANGNATADFVYPQVHVSNGTVAQFAFNPTQAALFGAPNLGVINSTNATGSIQPVIGTLKTAAANGTLNTLVNSISNGTSSTLLNSTVPEFGGLVGIVILISIIGVIVITKKYSCGIKFLT